MCIRDRDALRLSDPNDVRYEIATAIRRKVPIIPVLLDDAKLPSEMEMPIEMRGLLARQAMPLRFESFDEDAAKIAEAIQNMKPPRSVPTWMVGVGVARG